VRTHTHTYIRIYIRAHRETERHTHTQTGISRVCSDSSAPAAQTKQPEKLGPVKGGDASASKKPKAKAEILKSWHNVTLYSACSRALTSENFAKMEPDEDGLLQLKEFYLSCDASKLKGVASAIMGTCHLGTCHLCMCMCIFICMHTHAYATPALSWVRVTWVRVTCACACVYSYICTQMHTRIYLESKFKGAANAVICTYPLICMFVSVCERESVCVCVCVYHLISICIHVYIAGPYDLDDPPVLSELCSLLEKQFGQQVWFDFQKFEEDGSLGPVKKVQDETSFEVSSCVSFRLQCYTSAPPFFLQCCTNSSFEQDMLDYIEIDAEGDKPVYEGTLEIRLYSAPPPNKDEASPAAAAPVPEAATAPADKPAALPGKVTGKPPAKKEELEEIKLHFTKQQITVTLDFLKHTK
jgi:hypothetical protein